MLYVPDAQRSPKEVYINCPFQLSYFERAPNSFLPLLSDNTETHRCSAPSGSQCGFQRHCLSLATGTGLCPGTSGQAQVIQFDRIDTRPFCATRRQQERPWQWLGHRPQRQQPSGRCRFVGPGFRGLPNSPPTPPPTHHDVFVPSDLVIHNRRCFYACILLVGSCKRIWTMPPYS
jgi:hypothetical protein